MSDQDRSDDLGLRRPSSYIARLQHAKFSIIIFHCYIVLNHILFVNLYIQLDQRWFNSYFDMLEDCSAIYCFV